MHTGDVTDLWPVVYATILQLGQALRDAVEQQTDGYFYTP